MTLPSKAWLNFVAPLYLTHETSSSENNVAETNTIPPETGVYVAATDPNEAPQFSWTDGKHGKFLFGRTFNQLNLNALGMESGLDKRFISGL